MRKIHLKLNDAKTEFTTIGYHTELRHLSGNDGIRIGHSIIKASPSVRNIGAIFDRSLTMKVHILLLSHQEYWQCQEPSHQWCTLIHAFVASTLDHMHVLLYRLPKYLLYKIQKIQNNGARIVCRMKCTEHITSVLKNLHWLPIDFRIEFNILLTTFKALTGLAPGNIHDMLHPYQPPMALRSMKLTLLKRLSAKRKTVAGKSFAAVTPKLWNKLPLMLR